MSETAWGWFAAIALAVIALNWWANRGHRVVAHIAALTNCKHARRPILLWLVFLAIFSSTLSAHGQSVFEAIKFPNPLGRGCGGDPNNIASNRELSGFSSSVNFREWARTCLISATVRRFWCVNGKVFDRPAAQKADSIEPECLAGALPLSPQQELAGRREAFISDDMKIRCLIAAGPGGSRPALTAHFDKFAYAFIRRTSQAPSVGPIAYCTYDIDSRRVELSGFFEDPNFAIAGGFANCTTEQYRQDKSQSLSRFNSICIRNAADGRASTIEAMQPKLTLHVVTCIGESEKDRLAIELPNVDLTKFVPLCVVPQPKPVSTSPTSQMPELVPPVVSESDEPLFGGDKPMMVGIFTVLTHVTLLLAALGQLTLIIVIILKFSAFIQEQIMRSLAAACGLLIYVGAKAVGVSIPDLIIQSLSTTLPLSIGLLGIALPALSGFILAWYVVRFLNSTNALRNVVGMRVLTLIMTFVFFLYCDAYIAAYGETRGILYLLPNLSFVLSILLYAIFKYHPARPSER